MKIILKVTEVQRKQKDNHLNLKNISQLIKNLQCRTLKLNPHHLNFNNFLQAKNWALNLILSKVHYLNKVLNNKKLFLLELK